ncbi:hypothetical protein QTN25_010492 [Entamoeba marina]
MSVEAATSSAPNTPPFEAVEMSPNVSSTDENNVVPSSDCKDQYQCSPSPKPEIRYAPLGTNEPIQATTTHYIAPVEASKMLLDIGKKKAMAPTLKMIALSLYAGMLLGFGGHVSVAIGKNLPTVDTGLAKAILGFFFSAGLNLIVFTGTELYTSNCAFLIPGFIKGTYPRWLIFKAFIIVYFGNMIGMFFVTTFFSKLLGTFDSDIYKNALIAIGESKVAMSWWQAFISGIACNWIVCLAVYISIQAKDMVGKMAILCFLVLVFVASGFEHCIANMFFLPLAQMYGADFTLWEWLGKNLAPVTLGNTVGGVFFVGIPLWYFHLSDVYSIPFFDPNHKKTN